MQGARVGQAPGGQSCSGGECGLISAISMVTWCWRALSWQRGSLSSPFFPIKVMPLECEQWRGWGWFLLSIY